MKAAEMFAFESPCEANTDKSMAETWHCSLSNMTAFQCDRGRFVPMRPGPRLLVVQSCPQRDMVVNTHWRDCCWNHTEQQPCQHSTDCHTLSVRDSTGRHNRSFVTRLHDAKHYLQHQIDKSVWMHITDLTVQNGSTWLIGQVSKIEIVNAA